MKIYDFEIVDRCLYYKKLKTLVVGDLHLGYEAGLFERGVSIPRTQFNETIDIFERIFAKIGIVNKIILLGDVKHVFGKIMRQERDDFLLLVTFFRKFLSRGGKIIITAGNHDKILEPIIRNYKNIRLVDKYILGDILFIHGDDHSIKKSYTDIKNREIRLVVLGHFHPAYLLKDKGLTKEQKYKCFLYGYSSEYGKRVIFIPSFFPLIEGSDIIKDLKIYEDGMQLVLITDNGKTYSFKKLY